MFLISTQHYLLCISTLVPILYTDEYTDESDEEVEGERNPADGESPHEETLDDDEDAKNPAFIPR